MARRNVLPCATRWGPPLARTGRRAAAIVTASGRRRGRPCVVAAAPRRSRCRSRWLLQQDPPRVRHTARTGPVRGCLHWSGPPYA